MPEFALCGRNVKTYLTNNNYVNDYLSRNEPRREAFLGRAGGPLKNVWFEDLFEKTWIDGSKAFFQDQNGNTQFILGDDQVIFFPPPTPDWWEILEGTYPVPTTINIVPDAIAALNSIKEIAGMFSFAQVTLVPVRMVPYVGDTFLPTIKVPDAVFQATVRF